MKKHFFFDLDGTLTESKQKMLASMKCALKKLKGEVIVISGASREQMYKQLDGYVGDYLMPQSGASCAYWEYKFTDKEIEEINTHIQSILENNSSQDKVQNRGSQVAFSLIGHNTDLFLKKSFDPDGVSRKELLKVHPFESKTIEVRIAGTTCLDYTHKEYTKGKNIGRLIKKLGWKRTECVYFGDALFGGGNDETVKGVINTVEVKDPDDLLVKLKKYYD